MNLSDLSINGYQALLVLWNIFLALIPCWIVYFLFHHFPRKKWSSLSLHFQLLFLVLFFIWFFFFPNTAYLFTMVRHLVDYCSGYDAFRVCPAESWVVMVFFLYALVGLPTYLYALSRMSGLLGLLFHKKLRVIFPVFMIPLTAIGVLFGLFERYNSWEILTRPAQIIRTALGYFTDSSALLNLAVYSAVLYFVYYGFSFFFTKFYHR